MDFEEYIGESLEYWHKEISSILKEWCEEAGVKTPIGYYKNPLKHCWEIYTDRPGLLVGKAGSLVGKYKDILNKRCYCNYEVKFYEIKGGFANWK